MHTYPFALLAFSTFTLHPEKTGEKRFYYKQDVSPSRASSAKKVFAEEAREGETSCL